MKQLSVVVLKGCSYETMSPYRLCVPNAFGGRAGSAVHPSRVLPQSVLATTILVGGVGLEVGEAGAGSRVKVGLALCSLAITGLFGVESTPSC